MIIDINLFLTRTPNIDCGFCCSSIHLLVKDQQKPVSNHLRMNSTREGANTRKPTRPAQTITTYDPKTGLRTETTRELSDEEIREGFREVKLEGGYFL